MSTTSHVMSAQRLSYNSVPIKHRMNE